MKLTDARVLELAKINSATLADVEMEFEVRLVEAGFSITQARNLILLHAVLARQEGVRA